MHVFFIHGLNSSSSSFNYLTKELGEAQSKINYKSYQSLSESIGQVAKQLPKNEPIILVGHSLGGVIATIIAQAGNHDVQKLITISSPLAGSKAAVFARWFVQGVSVLSDITPTSSRIKKLLLAPEPCPTISIISTGGGLPHVVGAEPNDSVVAVSSQKALSYAKKFEVKANHFEVLLHDRTVDIVRKFIETEK